MATISPSVRKLMVCAGSTGASDGTGGGGGGGGDDGEVGESMLMLVFDIVLD